MQIEEVQIPRKITQQMLHHAQSSPDAEICGLISSLNGNPVGCYPIENIADQPQSRFLLDAKQQITALATMRERNEELFAIYHSHPTATAQPSQTDLNMAAYPGTLNLIISLNTKGVLEIRAFRIAAHKAREVALSLTPE